MKYQTTNQTLINAMANDQSQYIIDMITNGMTFEDAIESAAFNAMQDFYDEEEYDAPYDETQLAAAFKAAAIEALTLSATDLWNYAQAHPSAYLRDEGNARVISFQGKEYKVVTGSDNEDDYFV